MTEYFVDTFWYVALLNRRDQHHRLVSDYDVPEVQLVTSIWVLVEVANSLSIPPVRSLLNQLMTDLGGADSDTKVIPANQQWFDRGWNLYRQRPDKDWSLTDCISFEIMRDRGITHALTGDNHFTQVGFQAMFAEPL